MKAVRLEITQTEKELLLAIGNVHVINTLEDGTMKVQFAFARWLSMQELMQIFESAIQYQESDQGDWLRAKEWRAAESGLKDKIRKAYLRIYTDEIQDDKQTKGE